ncbi:hypothetical protein [Variovorax sp. PCZ-1]|uniref:hypothetical protein n=1 Tax=Variovorax sp. PCZ-1 TaxID=2835533 RepID=UPI001BCCA9AD|nr:hypothetical protein [Variovorax sp. PCZ-1]MBS7808539.1 hypothetical protein [Variovorax sp. PCZ-1]
MNQPTLHQLADHYGTDKGFNTLNAHGYTRIYESLLRNVREQPLRILEIGLLHPALHQSTKSQHGSFSVAPSLQMWAHYLPRALIAGFDIEDFSSLQHDRIQTWRADQSDRASLNLAAEQACQRFGGAFDLIIDDGSHSSAHQQITLVTLLPYLHPTGAYVIEDLHYQPSDIELPGISKTRQLLKGLAHESTAQAIQTVLKNEELAWLQTNIASIHFFDSLDRDRPNPVDSMDALAVIKRAII